MKIIATDLGTYFNVSILSKEGNTLHSYHFNTKKEMNAYLSGMQTARIICSNLVQDFPISHETKKATVVGLV